MISNMLSFIAIYIFYLVISLLVQFLSKVKKIRKVYFMITLPIVMLIAIYLNNSNVYYSIKPYIFADEMFILQNENNELKIGCHQSPFMLFILEGIIISIVITHLLMLS